MNATRVLLLFLLSAAACGQEYDAPDVLVPLESVLMGAAADPVQALKVLREKEPCNGPALRDYRRLIASLRGEAADAADARLAAMLAPADAFLTHDQRAFWQELWGASDGILSVGWDSVEGTPLLIENTGISIVASSAAEAVAELLRQFEELMGPAFPKSNPDEAFEMLTEEPGAGADGQVGSTYLLLRSANGIVVRGDFLAVTFRPSCGGRFELVLVTSRWTPGVVFLRGALDAADVADCFLPEGQTAQLTREPRLVVPTLIGRKTPAFEVAYDSPEGARVAYVDPDSCETVATLPQATALDGAMRGYTGVAGDGADKNLHSLTRLNLYEDRWGDPGVPTNTCTALRSCYPSSLLGSTDTAGSYTGLTPADPNDLTWCADLQGSYAVDDTRPCQCAAGHCSCDYVFGMSFTGDSTANIPSTSEENTSKRRRVELYYHATHAGNFFKNFAYGVPTYEPVKIRLETPECCDSDSGSCGPDMDCTAPAQYSSCLGGDALADRIRIKLGRNIGIQNSAWLERRLRFTVYHEFDHTLSFLAHGGTMPYSDAYMAYEEGRADFGGVITNRHEDTTSMVSGACEPDVSYSGTWHRQIFSGLFLEYAHLIGPGPSSKDVHTSSYMGTVDANTDLVGDCYVGGVLGTVDNCPSNTHYRKLLASNKGIWLGKWQSQFEISKAFHNHVADPVPPAGNGKDAFPWADQVNNAAWRAPFIAGAELSTSTDVSSGPEPGSGALKLDYAVGSSDWDYDSFLFFGRAGKQYKIETRNVAPWMDTKIDILDDSFSEILLGTNDDCTGYGTSGSKVVACPSSACEGGDQTYRSCVLFTPAYDRYYAVRVYPYDISSTGNTKTYSVRVAAVADDIGDTRSAASPLADAGSAFPRAGRIDGAGDKDVFRIASGTSQSLNFKFCSATIPITARVLNVWGGEIATATWMNCTGNAASANVATGTSFIEVSSSSAAGDYSGWAYLPGDIDGGGGPSGAFTLQGWTPQGPLYGFKFETASDEDWFVFTATQGQAILIDTFGLGSQVDTILEVYPEAGKTFYSLRADGTQWPCLASTYTNLGHWMVSDDDGGIEDRASRLEFAAPVTGSYYLRVRNKAGAGAGPYYLSFFPTMASVCCYATYP